MKTLLLRLCLLEEELRRTHNADIWVDLDDNKVCISTANRRGEELTFPSVYQCVVFTEKWMRASVAVTGLAFISDVTTLLLDEPFIMVSDDVLSRMGVVLNLAKWRGDSLVELALVSWLHGRGEGALRT